MSYRCQMLHFFGGFHLRAGALMALTIHAIWGLFLMFFATLELCFGSVYEHVHLDRYFFNFEIIGVMYIMVTILSVISVTIFALGISKNNSALVMTWLIIDVLQIILASCIDVWVMYSSKLYGTTITLGLSAVKIYFWFVTLSFYYELLTIYPPTESGHARLA